MAKSDPTKVTWKPDEVAERLMRDRGHVVLGYEWLPLGKIDLKESIRKNTRMDNGLSAEENIGRYAADMLAGHAFPAVVAMRCGLGMHELLGGCTRSQAAVKAGDDSVYALVVANLSDGDAEYARTVLNTKHGSGISFDALVRKAVLFHVRDGITADRLGKDFGISTPTIQKHVAAFRVSQATGCDFARAKVPVEHVQQLNKLAKLAPVQKAAAVMLCRVHLRYTAQDWKRRIDDVLKCGSEALMLEAVQKLGEGKQRPGKVKGGKATVAERFQIDWQRFANKIHGLDDLGLLSADEVAKFYSEWTEVVSKVNRLMVAGLRRGA